MRNETEKNVAPTASVLVSVHPATLATAACGEIASSLSLRVQTIALAQLPALVVLLLVLVISGGGPPV